MGTAVDDCDDCVPAYMKHSSSAATFSTLPFVLTFLFVTVIVHEKVFPLLSSPTFIKSPRTPTSGFRTDNAQAPATPQSLANRLAAYTFSSTIALSAVLTELLLCEISNSFNPTARSIALQLTVSSLLVLLIVLIPLLEISSIISGAGWKFFGDEKGRLRLAWVLEVAGFTIFLAGFWLIGSLLPHEHETAEGQVHRERHTLIDGSLERLGITGISLMALLSGFASVSSIWQNFGTKPRPVSEASISRKKAGLDASLDMLGSKKERLRQLERKISAAPVQGFWQKAVGTLRGNADTQELRTLELEISGLETMSVSLETSLSILESRRSTQLRSTSPLGKLSIAASYAFSCYCVYRIGTVSLNIIRGIFTTHSSKYTTIISSNTSTTSDPITNTLALITTHLYPALNAAAWTQSISFLLSGAMLLASFSAVLQTFHLFARLVPGVLHAARSNVALIIAQVTGMYVISSALMLRGVVPEEVGGVVDQALGKGVLEMRWVQGWFEGWFMGAVLVTAGGLWVGRRIGGLRDWGEEEEWDYGAGTGDVEMGKRA